MKSRKLVPARLRLPAALPPVELALERLHPRHEGVALVAQRRAPLGERGDERQRYRRRRVGRAVGGERSSTPQLAAVTSLPSPRNFDRN